MSGTLSWCGWTCPTWRRLLAPLNCRAQCARSGRAIGGRNWNGSLAMADILELHLRDWLQGLAIDPAPDRLAEHRKRIEAIANEVGTTDALDLLDYAYDGENAD